MREAVWDVGDGLRLSLWLQRPFGPTVVTHTHFVQLRHLFQGNRVRSVATAVAPALAPAPIAAPFSTATLAATGTGTVAPALAAASFSTLGERLRRSGLRRSGLSRAGLGLGLG